MKRVCHPDMPDARAIAALSEASAPEFIRQELAAKTFHKTMRALNEDVLSGDPDRRAAATKALKRLGFL